MKKISLPILLLFAFLSHSQSTLKKIKITGTVVSQETSQPLEYATVILQNTNNPALVTGGITNQKGKFNITVDAGYYDILVEFISYKTYEKKKYKFLNSKDFGEIKLAQKAEQLAGVELIADKTTVELRLDKKIYNVGKDLTVIGGSASDVLNNIPSVSVDAQGTISLRGNTNVKILINGKPSTLSGISPEALKQMPVSSIEKVEVITNPSSKYSSSGSAGILNIILRKNKKSGISGSVSTTFSDPKSQKIGTVLNLKRKNFNLFSNTAYTDRERPGYSLFNNDFYDSSGITTGYENEYRSLDRHSKNLTATLGLEILLNTSSSLTNSISYTKTTGLDHTGISIINFDEPSDFLVNRTRNTVEDSQLETVSYAANYNKKFNAKGHLLTVDYQYTRSLELEDRAISEAFEIGSNNWLFDKAITDNHEISQLLQVDYILPFGQAYNSKIELGYSGVFDNYHINYLEGAIINNSFVKNYNFSNDLVYNQKVNAAYLQFGQGFNKLTISAGMRVENTDVSVLLTNSHTVDNKSYTNWFPSLFLGYELSTKEKLSLNFSSRIGRPTAGNLNPFPNRVSKTNLYYGNPDLTSMFTNSFEFNYLNKWNKITFTSALYYKRTNDVLQNVTIETGDTETITSNGTDLNAPIIAKTKRNIGKEDRYGIDVTTTFVPLKDYRFSLNTLLYKQNLTGTYVYHSVTNEIINTNFEANQVSWFSKFSAKFPLIYKVDFQSNFYHIGPNTNSQTKTKSLTRLDIALSKSILKNKASISIGVTDIFNQYIRYSETQLSNSQSYNELQSDQRNIRATFTYKLN
ncbi:TonB-dependent receptor [Cellulophaga sp. F20128]|uniref:outer membrane beta-barrel family protein n=1 Tax=Cellulophaga sp. F20128 TaxID=2926413 RepID=UPI001FF232CD|nr:outer membrane beta-barrel family protein [Cellulophaga sp. F20128]MCK0156652.1 TonB-dependent receptor [Cellulophaga sp. F20128]